MNKKRFKGKLYKFIELFIDIVILIVSFNFVSISVGDGILESIETFFDVVKNDFFTTPLKMISNNISLAIQNFTIIVVFIVISRIYRTSLLEKKYSKAMYALFMSLFLSNLVVITRDFYVNDIENSSPIVKLFKSTLISFIALTLSRLILWQYVKRRNNQSIAIVAPKNNAEELLNKFFNDEFNYKTLKYLILEEGGTLPVGYEKKLDECNQTYISEDLTSESKTEIIDYVIYNGSSSVNVIPKYYELAITSSKVSRVDDTLALSVKPLTVSLMYKFIKRTIDILVAIVFLLITAPFAVITAIVNKFYYKIPIFTYEKNITYKLRTFERVTFNVQKGLYTTKYGKFMELTGISDLPMFYNVLMGSMSIVGAKPHSKSYLTEKDGLESIKFRKNIKAGILSYEGMYTSDNATIDETIRFDVYYVTNASFYEDVKIVLLSFANIFKIRNKQRNKDTSLRDIANSNGYSIVTKDNIYYLEKNNE